MGPGFFQLSQGAFYMKISMILAVAILAMPFAAELTSHQAFAYSSNTGPDPDAGGEGELETRVMRKTTVGGESSSVSRGHILSYASAADGYTMTRIGDTSGAGQNRVACIAKDDIATGDVAYHRCVTKGYVDFLKYDASLPITAFHNLCVSVEGIATACPASYGATRNTGIMSLETKASGTGSTLKAIINLR
jgi:hypothetical protein